MTRIKLKMKASLIIWTVACLVSTVTGFSSPPPPSGPPPSGYTSPYPQSGPPPYGYTSPYPQSGPPPYGYTSPYPHSGPPPTGYPTMPDGTMPPYYFDDYDFGTKCPEGSIFCFETLQCINEDLSPGPCIDPLPSPTSPPMPEPEFCVDNRKCYHDGQVRCVDTTTSCEYVEVSMMFNTQISDVVGPMWENYGDQLNNVVGQLAIYGAGSPDMFWDMFLWEDDITQKTGFYCKAAGELADQLNLNFLSYQRPINNLDGSDLMVNWNSTHVWTSQYGDRPVCIEPQRTCYLDDVEAFHCTDREACYYSDIVIKLPDLPFSSVMSVSYQQIVTGILDGIMGWIGEDRNLLWDYFLYEEGTYTMFYARCSPVIYERLQQFFNTHPDLTTVLLYGEVVDWDNSHFLPPHIDVDDYTHGGGGGGGGGYYEEDGIKCMDDEVFCFETRQCLKMDGSCSETYCSPDKVKCYHNGQVDCIEWQTTCEYVEVMLKFNIPLLDIVGYDWGQYEQQKTNIIAQLASLSNGNPDMFWDAYLWNETDTSMFYCKAAGELYSSLYEHIISYNSPLYAIDGMYLMVDTNSTHVWTAQYGQTHECYEPQVTCYSDEFQEFQCIDRQYCSYADFRLSVEVDYYMYAMNNYDVLISGFTSELLGWIGRDDKLIWDDFLYEAGGYTVFYGRISPAIYSDLVMFFDGSSQTYLQGYRIDWASSQLVPPHTDYYGGGGGGGGGGYYEEEGIKCGDDQMFCFETRQCINQDLSQPCMGPSPSPEPECVDNRKCYHNGEVTCIDAATSCEYVEVVTMFNLPFMDVVGNSWELYDDQLAYIIEQLASYSGGHSDMYWDMFMWEDGLTTGFYCKAAGELFDNINLHFLSYQSPIFHIHGSDLLVNWTATHVWTSQYGDMGMCMEPQRTCYLDDVQEFHCTDRQVCYYSDIVVSLPNLPFSEVMSAQYEAIITGIINGIMGWIWEDKNLLWDYFLYEEGTNTMFYARCSPAVYERLQQFLNSEPDLSLITLMNLTVDWTNTHFVPPHIDDGDYTHGGGGGGGGYYEEDGIKCMENELFCFERHQCVSAMEIDTPCNNDTYPEPVCERNEVLQWRYIGDGYEECVHFRVECGSRANVCIENGTLYCNVYNDTCEYIAVSVSVAVMYTDLVDHDMILPEALVSLSAAMAINNNMIWLAEILENMETGYTDIVFNVPLEVEQRVVDYFNNQLPTLYIAGAQYDIDWANSEYTLPGSDEQGGGIMLISIPMTLYNFRQFGLMKDDLELVLQEHINAEMLEIELLDVAVIPTDRGSNTVTAYVELSSTIELHEYNLFEFLSVLNASESLTNLEEAYLDLVSVTPISTTPSHRVFPRSFPIRGGSVPASVTLDSIIPVGELSLDPSTTIGVVCPENTVLLEKDGTATSSIEVLLTDTFTVSHNLAEYELVKCQLFTSQNTGDVLYYVGFIALPEDIGQVTDITLKDNTGIQIFEDSQMINIPSELFMVTTKADTLLTRLGGLRQEIADANENWGNKDMSGLQILQMTTLSLFDITQAIIDDMLVSVTMNPVNVGKMYFRNEFMTTITQRVGLLSDSSSISLEINANFNGTFNLEFNISTWSISVPVEVIGQPDPPEIRDVDITTGSERFVYNPAFPLYVSDIIDVKYVDVDGHVDGMLLFGYVNKQVTIDGLWEYTVDSGDSWEAVDELVFNDTMDVVQATVLVPDAMLRFTPSLTDTWLIDSAPAIAFTVFDELDEITTPIADIFISQSRAIGSGISKFSKVSPTYIVDIVVFPLASYGCDGVLNSGMVAGPCGCPDNEECYDCEGTANGGAMLDLCGICNGDHNTLEDVDCYNESCYSTLEDYCESIFAEEDYLNQCPQGTYLNQYSMCGYRCMVDGETVNDNCGVPCGNDECLDCAGVEDGTNIINWCGDCELPDVTPSCLIGELQPRYVHYLYIGTVSIPYSDTLTITDGDIDCYLNGDIQIPTVVAIDTDLKEIQLTPVLTEDNAQYIGFYVVTCRNKSSSTILLEKDFTVYGPPTLSLITPASTELNDNYATVTIDGSGFFDTGSLFCVAPCQELELPCQGYRGVRGSRINDTQVECPVFYLRNIGKGKTYHASVTLLNMTEIRYHSLPDESIVINNDNMIAIDVVVRAPEPISAVLSSDGCNTIEIKFNVPIKIDVDDVSQCSSYINIDVSATCRLHDKKVYVSAGASGISDGDELTFVDGKIKNANDMHDAAGTNYLTGGGTIVVSAADSLDSEKPLAKIADIPGTVGCDDLVLKPRYFNIGCFVPEITWSLSPMPAGLTFDPASNAQRILYSQLDLDVDYTVTMTYTIGSISDQDTKVFTKDADQKPTVTIHGAKNNTDTTEVMKLKANVKICGSESYGDETILWQIGSRNYSDQMRSVFIPAGVLQADYEYEAKVTVYIGSYMAISKVFFYTGKTKLRPAVSLNGATIGDFIESAIGEQLEVSCIDTANNEDDITCMWTCALDNTGSYGPHCFDNGNIWRETAQTVTLPQVSDSSSTNTSYTYKLTMTAPGSDAATFYFKVMYVDQSVIQLPQPQIEYRGESSHISVGSNERVINLKARCRYTTEYTWKYKEIDPETLTAIGTDGDTFASGDLTNRNANGNTNCGTTLDVSSLFPDGDEAYHVTLTAINDNRQESYVITLTAGPKPGAGSVDVYQNNEDGLGGDAIALKTTFELTMTGWMYIDEYDFICRGYFKNVGADDWIPINTVPTSPSLGIQDFTLPDEGEHSIKVECCNGYGCASNTASSTITVVAQSTPDVIDTVLNIYPNLIITSADAMMSILPFAVAAVDNAGDTGHTEVQMNLAVSIVTESINVAIQASLTASITEDTLIYSLEASVTLTMSCPGKVSQQAKNQMQVTTVTLMAELTGVVPLSSRRKRSTSTVESYAGISQENAIIALDVFSATLSGAEITQESAEDFVYVIDTVMVGMCQQFTGSTPWIADADLSYVTTYGTDLAAYDTTVYVADNGTGRAEILFGSEVSDLYGGSWECNTVWGDNCTHVCLSTALVTVDTYSPSVGIIAPLTRMSKILDIQLINPDTYRAETVDNLNVPVQITLSLDGTVNTTQYDYKCLMFLLNEWNEEECTAAAPVYDAGLSQYTVVCSCQSIGIVAVFQDLANPDVTTTSTTTTTTTTTPMPSLYIAPNTNYLNYSFTFIDDYNVFVSGNEAAFIADLKSQLAQLTSLSASLFSNFNVNPGSIIVTFEVHESGAILTLGQIAYILDDVFTSGNITFTALNGTVLTLDPSSFTYVELQYESDNDSEDEGSSSTGAIVGAVIGTLVAVLVVGGVVLFILKKKGIIKIGDNTSAVPKDPPPRYEVGNSHFGSIPPPPPYLYQDTGRTAQADKWIEDEVEKKVALIRESENGEGSPGSSRCESAGLSAVQNDGDEKKKLPSVSDA